MTSPPERPIGFEMGPPARSDAPPRGWWSVARGAPVGPRITGVGRARDIDCQDKRDRYARSGHCSIGALLASAPQTLKGCWPRFSRFEQRQCPRRNHCATSLPPASIGSPRGSLAMPRSADTRPSPRRSKRRGSLRSADSRPPSSPRSKTGVYPRLWRRRPTMRMTRSRFMASKPREGIARAG